MRRIVIVLMLVVFVGVFIPAPVGAMTGSGTSGDPYIISDVDDLQDMDLELDVYYELGCDIDASATSGWNGGAGFVPVATFTGTFDGKGYTIYGLYENISSSSASVGVGLFGAATGATIKNVKITGADITVSVEGATYACNAGVLVAELIGGTVQDVYVAGSVSGTCTDTTIPGSSHANVGGLIGSSFSNGVTIQRCASSVTVLGIAEQKATACVGGLVGIYSGYGSTINNSYATGSVTGSHEIYGVDVGGLVGFHQTNGAIDNCYSTGAVTSNDDSGGLVGVGDIETSDSFWDTQTSGQASSAGGTGKTTAQMKTESTFTDANWDFDTIWDIGGHINDGYPYLLWWYDPYPFADYDVYQVQWFEPITIISGTTLPDRTSTQNGVITWGANPAGIAIVMGELVSDAAVPSASSPVSPTTSIPDMTGESGQPGWTSAQPTLPDNPIYPLVSMMSDNTNIPIWLWWVILAIGILFIIMMVSFRYAPHQLITAIAGGGWCGFMYHVGIFPFWVMFIFAAMAAAIIIGERTPTVS